MSVLPLGIVGTYLFSSPVSLTLGEEKLAMAEAISSIASLEQDLAFNVLKTVYLDNGLTDTDYNNDKANKVTIVKFRFSNEKIYYVPLTSVVGMPSEAGVPYVGTAVALTLGMLPEDLNIDNLMADIATLCNQRYGMEVDTTKVIVTDTVRLLEYEHARLEQQRLAKILPEEQKVSNLYDIENIQKSLARAEQQVRYLESYILRCLHCKPCTELTERVSNDVSLLENCGSFESPLVDHGADSLFTSEDITHFKNS